MSYSNGLPEGNWQYYYESGKIKSTIEFKDGKKDGLWAEYDTSGKKTHEASYRADSLLK
jgi:antitoxin component YwqK of YwqJK toxin-antitoxin module